MLTIEPGPGPWPRLGPGPPPPPPPVALLVTIEAGGRNDAVDLKLPACEIRADPGKEGVRVSLETGRGPSGARGTSLRFIEGRGGCNMFVDSEEWLLLPVRWGCADPLGPALRGGWGMGAEMIGMGALIIIVDARLARGALGPPGRDGGPMVGRDGRADTVVVGVNNSGGVPPLRSGGARLETSLLGGLLSFSLSLLSVADCVPRLRMLAFRPKDEKKPADPDLTAADSDFGGGS